MGLHLIVKVLNLFTISVPLQFMFCEIGKHPFVSR